MASSSFQPEQLFEINLAEEDESELAIQEGDLATENECEFNWRLSLVGRFIATGSVDFPSMQQTLAAIWKPGKGVYMKELDTNRFLFQFFHEIDIKRVIDGSPWFFNRKALVIARMESDYNPRLISLNSLDLWVQVFELPTGFMSSRILEAIGGFIGKFKESCPKNFMGVWRDYMRIRISVDLNSPLKRRMRLRKGNNEWIWVTFKYENVPTFCFICGKIGHSDKFCPKRFEMPEEDIVHPYGEWMRAPFRRQNKLIGQQWLRSSWKEDEAPQPEVRPPIDLTSSFTGAREGITHNPDPPSLNHCNQILPMNRGVELMGSYGPVFNHGQPSTNSSNNGEDSCNQYGVDFNGSLVIETKKRRENPELGPSVQVGQEIQVNPESDGDEPMALYSNSDGSPKNFITAGPVSRSRQES
ncbi:uncharacterized protein At4g02000-like [Humulus lupulus]|uniref:uncharacterized protein At4g02000-like n=1 Tax=Humulus lupulus TaxID=3486 RepID=UPI002B41559B|nr:uncharacterized protein At4g02000-like [Humulus lupulus]